MKNNTLTWKQFKEEIDKLLSQNEIPEDALIWFIDVSWPQAGNLLVGKDEDGKIIISE